MSNGSNIAVRGATVPYTMVPKVVMSDPELSLGARCLYALLLGYAFQSDETFVGQERLADELGVTTRTVRNYLAELVEADLLDLERRGNNLTNLYTFLDITGRYPSPTPSKPKRKPKAKRSKPKKRSMGTPSEEGGTGNQLPVRTGNQLPPNKKQGKKNSDPVSSETSDGSETVTSELKHDEVETYLSVVAEDDGHRVAIHLPSLQEGMQASSQEDRSAFIKAVIACYEQVGTNERLNNLIYRQGRMCESLEEVTSLLTQETSLLLEAKSSGEA